MLFADRDELLRLHGHLTVETKWKIYSAGIYIRLQLTNGNVKNVYKWLKCGEKWKQKKNFKNANHAK